MEREGAKDGDGEWQDACGFHVLVFGELLLRKWPRQGIEFNCSKSI
jgi:hypothetical protein